MAAAFVLGLLMTSNAQESGNWSTDLELRGAFPALPGDAADLNDQRFKMITEVGYQCIPVANTGS